MTASNEVKYYGVAVSIPTILVGGAAQLVYGKAAIEQALAVLLSTPYGTKFFLYDYGCRLDELLFEPNDEVLDQMGSYFIKEAIDKWEGRVEFVSADLDIIDDKREFYIEYRNKQTNEIDSFIYPFYTRLKY